MTEKETKTIEKFGNFVMKNNVSNEFLVQIIELSGAFLSLMTIPDYCKKTGISYNGAKKFRTVKNILGVKWVIDNK